MFVSLAMGLLGMGFGRIKRDANAYKMHRWVMSVAVILNLTAIFLVMLPSAFLFYTDPDVMVFEPMSLTTIAHAIIGVPAIITAIIYVVGDLPSKTKSWMRTTSILWVSNIGIGIFMFLQMMQLI